MEITSKDYLSLYGVTSTSILTNCIRHIGGNVNYFTSNRFTEGYGISVASIDRMLTMYPNTKFVITVDNGIVAFEAIEKLKDYGINTVIIDHHEPLDTGEVPNALAVCDPKQKDDKYPFKELCGAGLAYKVMRYMYEHYNKDISFVDSQLDLVALGTIADMVTLLNENRLYVKKGLEMIKKQTRLSLAILLNEIKMKFSVSEIDENLIGYYLGPTINAVGRINGDAMCAIELFTTDQRHIMDNNSRNLVALNEKRKDITLEESKVVKELIEKNHKDKNNVLIIHSENLHEGLVGLVAGRIKEEYLKPCIVLTKHGDIYKGSARSIEGFNIKDALDNVKDLLVHYGGHAMAAGIAIEEKNIDLFEQKMNEMISQLDCVNEQKLTIDAILNAQDVNIYLIDMLDKLKPFGQGFEKPIFGLKANIKDRQRIGKGDAPHLKLTDVSGLTILDFNGADNYEEIGSPVHIKCIGYPNKNVFRNQETAQFLINSHRIRER